MSRLLKGGQKETLEPKLDLKALQSFSPDWSPDLRYTACIAARYAAHACAEQAREVVERGAIQATCEKGEERMEKFEEEGDDTDKAAPTEQQRQRRRVDFIEDWAEFAQKFSTATCQHLGINEETLPPIDAGIKEVDVLQAAQGSQPQEGETDEKPKGGSLGAGQGVEVVHELLLVALGLGQYRASDGSTTLFEQDMLFGDLEEDEVTSPGNTSIPSRTSRTSLKETNKAIAEAEPRADAPPPAPRELDAVDQMQEVGAKAWGALSKGAVSGWSALSAGVTTGVAEARKVVQPAAQPAAGGSTEPGYQVRAKAQERAKSKPKAPTKPNEMCHYDARARAIIFRVAQAMGLQGVEVYQGEKALAQSIFFLLQEGRQAAEEKADGGDPLKNLPRDDARGAWMNKVSATTVDKEKRKAKWLKWGATGLGFAIGGTIIGLTGGLAAPLVAPALVGLTGVSFLATTSGIVLMGTLLGLGGGGLAGYRVQQRLRGLDSFEFVELSSQAREAGLAIPSLHATICVGGLLLKEEDQVKPWAEAFSKTIDSRDAYAVKAETKMMVEAGTGLRGYMLEQLMRTGGTKAAEQIIKHTALAGLAALTLPLTVFSAASAALDGVFVRAKTKAHKAGLVLAETLRKEVQGHRPVTLIGTSLGCTTILAALVELAKDPNENAHLIDSVYLINAPMTPSPSILRSARSIVSRRFVNAYSSKDMVCAIAAWLGSGISVEEMRSGQLPKVAGSGPITGVANVDNVDISDMISSHFEVCDAGKLQEVLDRCNALRG